MSSKSSSSSSNLTKSSKPKSKKKPTGRQLFGTSSSSSKKNKTARVATKKVAKSRPRSRSRASSVSNKKTGHTVNVTRYPVEHGSDGYTESYAFSTERNANLFAIKVALERLNEAEMTISDYTKNHSITWLSNHFEFVPIPDPVNSHVAIYLSNKYKKGDFPFTDIYEGLSSYFHSNSNNENNLDLHVEVEVTTIDKAALYDDFYDPRKHGKSVSLNTKPSDGKDEANSDATQSSSKKSKKVGGNNNKKRKADKEEKEQNELIASVVNDSAEDSEDSSSSSPSTTGDSSIKKRKTDDESSSSSSSVSDDLAGLDA